MGGACSCRRCHRPPPLLLLLSLGLLALCGGAGRCRGAAYPSHWHELLAAAVVGGVADDASSSGEPPPGCRWRDAQFQGAPAPLAASLRLLDEPGALLSEEAWASFSLSPAMGCGVAQHGARLGCWALNSVLPSHGPPADLLGLRWAGVAAGWPSCGLLENGTAACWRDGAAWSDPLLREAAAGGATFSGVAAAPPTVCGLAAADSGAAGAGELLCWGCEPEAAVTCPMQLPAEQLASSFAALALARLYGCGLLAGSRRAVCWQAPELALGPELGLGLPQDVATESWLAIATGDHLVCGIQAPAPRRHGKHGSSSSSSGSSSSGDAGSGSSGGSGQLVCWAPAAMQPEEPDGLADAILDAMPSHVDESRWSAVALGRYHACVIRSDGRMTCWAPVDHPLIEPEYKGRGAAIPAAYAKARWAAVTASEDATCGILAGSRHVVCWGLAGPCDEPPPELPPRPRRRHHYRIYGDEDYLDDDYFGEDYAVYEEYDEEQ